LGDYLLWNWSLGANRDVVALVSGVALIPLLIALAWLLVVAAVQLLAFLVRRPRAAAAAHMRDRAHATGLVRAAGGAARREPVPAAAGKAASGGPMPAAAHSASPSPSSQIAA
jgi:hypothetical protein